MYTLQKDIETMRLINNIPIRILQCKLMFYLIISEQFTALDMPISEVRRHFHLCLGQMTELVLTFLPFSSWHNWNVLTLQKVTSLGGNGKAVSHMGGRD